MNKSTSKSKAPLKAAPKKKPAPAPKKPAAVAKPKPMREVAAIIEAAKEYEIPTVERFSPVIEAAVAAFKDNNCRYNVSLGIYEMDRDVGDKLRQAVLALEGGKDV